MDGYGLKKVTDALEQLREVPYPLLWEILELRAYAQMKTALERAKTQEEGAALESHPMFERVTHTLRLLRDRGRIGIQMK